MKVFDYVSAWHNLAIPAWNMLPADVRALYLETCEVSRGLNQLSNLTMPWPNGFQNKFRAIETETLAKAARAIYSCGHWKPGHESFAGSETGAHWKFSHYADQELVERLNIPRTDPPVGKSIRIIEGYLRVCFSSPDSWQWEEIGPASIPLLEKCNAVPGIRSKGTRAQYEVDVNTGIMAAKALQHDRFISLDEFMREECAEKYCHSASMKGFEVCENHTSEANAKREHTAALRAVESARARLIEAETTLVNLGEIV